MLFSHQSDQGRVARITARAYLLALLLSGVTHAALFVPEWWQHWAPHSAQLSQQSLHVQLNVAASSQATEQPAHDADDSSLAPSQPNQALTPQQAPQATHPQSSPVSDGAELASLRAIRATVAVDTRSRDTRPQAALADQPVVPQSIADVPSSPSLKQAVVEVSAELAATAESTHQPMPASRAAAVSAQEKTPPSAVQPAGAETMPAVATPPAFELGSLHNPDPHYPLQARRRGWEGRVLLGVEVDVDGRSRVVDVLASSGYRALDQAALETIRDEWIFEPARLNQVAVAGYTKVPVVFRIKL